MKLVDAHCHLNDEKYENDIEEIVEEILNNMEFVVNSGWDYESSLKAIEQSNKYDNVYASIGFHPTDISQMTEEKLSRLEEIARQNPKILAIGEIGLDYHWMKDPEEVQKKALITQIEMLRRIDKPIVVHTREALEDTIKLLDGYKDVRGILHCFPGSYESVLPILDRYYVSVGGTLTFKNNRKTKDLVYKLPLDKIVIETDSPYLTPEPFRGRRNNPILTEYVAREIARIKDCSFEEVVEKTTTNAYVGYKLWK